MPYPAPYRLTFTLPDTLLLLAQPGRHHPCLHGCTVNVGRGGLVIIEGSSREQVFDQAKRFIRIIGKGAPPCQIAAISQSEHSAHGPGGRDGWTIILRAAVAIVPTRLGADIAAAR